MKLDDTPVDMANRLGLYDLKSAMEVFEESKSEGGLISRTESENGVCVHAEQDDNEWRALEFRVEEDFIILMNSHISFVKLATELD